VSGLLRDLDDEKLISHDTEPPQFTRVPFPVKALKLLLHELQTNGEAASMAVPTAPLDTGSDDGDSDWSDEEKVKDDRYALADLIGVGGMPFDEDEVLANNDDEDLQKDPVSQIDLRVREMNCWPFPILICLTLVALIVGPCHVVYLRERNARCGWIWGACWATGCGGDDCCAARFAGAELK
jgi:hypothetical protein